MDPGNIQSWLLKIVSQREMLLRSCKNRKNKMLMAENCDFLKMYLLAYSYNTPAKISRFLFENRDKVLSIIPGPGSYSHDTRIKELNDIMKYLEPFKHNHHEKI